MLVSGQGSSYKVHVSLSQVSRLALNARKGEGGISSAASETGVSTSVTTTAMSKQRYRACILKNGFAPSSTFLSNTRSGLRILKNGYNVWLMF